MSRLQDQFVDNHPHMRGEKENGGIDMYFTQYKAEKIAWASFSEDIYLLHQAVMELYSQHNDPGRVLYRAEAAANEAVVLVQSQRKPSAENLTLGLKPMGVTKEIDLANAFQKGAQYKFRLVAAPAMRPVKPNADGTRNRKPYYKQEEQMQWLIRKSEKGGFSLISQEPQQEWLGFDEADLSQVTITPIGKKEGKKEGKTITIYAVQFDGYLQVEDPALFYQAVKSGIGAAKGFGMGLLSLKKHR